MTWTWPNARAVARMLLWHLLDTVLTAIIPAKPGNSVAILRLDAIGDFVVWQVYAKFFREAYPGRRLVLLCNPACADLATALPYWDEVIGFDTNSISRSLAARWRGFRRLRSLGIEVTVNPVFSRSTRADAVARALGGRQRIGMDCDDANMPPHLKVISDRCYTRLVASPKEWLLESERARLFIAALLGRDVPWQQPNLPVLGGRPAELPAERYFIIFPGAASPGRRWPLARFIEVGSWLCETRGWAAVVAGGADDLGSGEVIRRGIGVRCVNLAGKTSVRQLVECVRHAELLVGNETSAVHIAAAVTTPAVAVLGGGHFGRFMPYPVGADLPLSAFETMPCFRCNWGCIFPTPPSDPKPCVAAVRVDEVKRLVRQAITGSSA